MMRARGAFAFGFAVFAVLAQSTNAQDVANGEDVFKKCRVCHNVGQGATNKIGPALQGIFGRKSGTFDGFSYSDVMRESGEKGHVWTAETIDKYLENPRSYMPGNKMAFVGVKDEIDRRDLIAYLKSATQ